ncbi:MAG TPA: helix-turn-helix transcriptional regulator [Rhodanobacteraceae bacterium]|nr:helix-turn-helix transcriptional regulator [Rhodanobacteraceae bacterium]
MDVRLRFGKRVRDLRARRGLTQEALAAASKLHVTYISSLERGHRNPSLQTCRAIASALNFSLSELFRDL